MNYYNVGDIVHALFEPRNKWEVIKSKGSIAKIKSLISGEEMIIHSGRINILTVFKDGRQYDFDKNKIYPKPYGKSIETVNDLFRAAAHYGLKDF